MKRFTEWSNGSV